MDTQFIAQRIDRLRVRINDMFKQLREPQANASEALEQSFVELVGALEELQVADEALSHQVEAASGMKTELDYERQRYQDLFNFLEDGYLLTDAGGKIQEANAPASKILHRPLRDLIDKPVVICIHEDDRHFFRGQVNRVGQTRQKQTFEVRARNPKAPDALSILHVTIAPGYDAEGKLTLLRWRVRDVTREKDKEQEANEYLNRFRSIFQSAGAGIMLLNRQGKIVEGSPALLRLTGYTFTELSQQQLTDLVHLEDLEAYAACYQPLFSDQKQKCRFEGRLLHKEGSIVWVRISMSCFHSPLHAENLVMNLVEDVTEKHLLEVELAETRKQLEKASHSIKNGKITEPAKGIGS